MKNIVTKFMTLSSVGLLMLSACKKSGELVTSNGGKAGTLTASATTVALSKANNSDTTTAISFSFTKANYGYSAAITNTLQIDSAGDNWNHPYSAALSNGSYSMGFSTPAFNTLLLGLHLTGGQTYHLNVRVQHSISAEVAPVYSNVVSMIVTPYNLSAWVYVPGQYEGWSNPGAQLDSLLSPTSNGVYSGIINFTAGNNQFLVIPVEGSWTNKWATNVGAATGTSVTYAVTYDGNNNFYAPTTAGQYLVTLNTNTNVLTCVPADYYSVIGNAALGWNPGDDISMKFINDGTNTWLASNVAMSAQAPPNNGFKIRQDDAWSYSWGTSGTTGILTDANTAVNIGIATAGNYNITFVMAPSVLGGSTTPSTTAAYTVTQQ